jgi:hypothetical protein
VGGNYPNDLTGAAGTWLAELDGALGSTGVWLSVQVGSETLTAGDSTGLTAQGLAAAVDRVWLDGSADTAACAQALTQAGLEEAQERLVLTGLVPAGWTGSRCAMLE